ncbi:MAG: hypothetical protein K2K91_10410 [Ruminococcus sp.]|nr:hypothetical protein [Ruminococcus sp.]
MPFINLKTNVITDDAQNTALKTAFGKAIEAIPGKSEDWLMVAIDDGLNLYFKGDAAPCAMVEVSVFGTENSAAYNVLTRKICDILNETLDIQKSRVYVKYDTTKDWGWNGGNF